MQRSGSGLDIVAYGRAFVLLFRNPTLVLAPLAMGVAAIGVGLIFPGGGPLSGLSVGVGQIVAFLLKAFGLSVALIQADIAWRRTRAPFAEAWEQARQKLPELILAAIGFNFLLFVALYAGGMLGPIGTIVLGIAALFFFVYTIPAAAIGGVPGGAALQASLERARSAPLPTALVIIVSCAAYWLIPYYVSLGLIQFAFTIAPAYAALFVEAISALAEAVAAAYVALILSKTYIDISYRRY